MTFVRDILICLVGGSLILGVPAVVWLLGRIASAVESMRSIEEERFRYEQSRWHS